MSIFNLGKNKKTEAEKEIVSKTEEAIIQQLEVSVPPVDEDAFDLSDKSEANQKPDLFSGLKSEAVAADNTDSFKAEDFSKLDSFKMVGFEDSFKSFKMDNFMQPDAFKMDNMDFNFDFKIDIPDSFGDFDKDFQNSAADFNIDFEDDFSKSFDVSFDFLDFEKVFEQKNNADKDFSEISDSVSGLETQKEIQKTEDDIQSIQKQAADNEEIEVKKTQAAISSASKRAEKSGQKIARKLEKLKRREALFAKLTGTGSDEEETELELEDRKAKESGNKAVNDIQPVSVPSIGPEYIKPAESGLNAVKTAAETVGEQLSYPGISVKDLGSKQPSGSDAAVTAAVQKEAVPSAAPVQKDAASMVAPVKETVRKEPAPMVAPVKEAVRKESVHSDVQPKDTVRKESAPAVAPAKRAAEQETPRFEAPAAKVSAVSKFAARIRRGYYTWAVVWDQVEEEKYLRRIDKQSARRNKQTAVQRSRRAA